MGLLPKGDGFIKEALYNKILATIIIITAKCIECLLCARSCLRLYKYLIQSSQIVPSHTEEKLEEGNICESSENNCVLQMNQNSEDSKSLRLYGAHPPTKHQPVPEVR